MSEIKRKPYVRPVKGDWWTKKPQYKKYILRESLAFFFFWFVIEVIILFYIANDLRGSTDLATEIKAQVKSFLLNPVVLILNVLTLIAAIRNTITWFALTPKALNIVKGDTKVKSDKISKTLYITTAVVTLVTIAIFVIAFI